MADLELSVKGTPVAFFAPGAPNSATGPATASLTLAAGDWVLIIADVDYRSVAPTVTTVSGISPVNSTSNGWTTIGTALDGSILTMAAYVGKVQTAGTKTLTVNQDSGGTSGLHAHAYVLTAASTGDAVLSVDGTVTTLTGSANRTAPFVHASLTPSGTKDLLFVAHGQIQFSGTSAYGAAPSGMTGLANYYNSSSGLQSAYQKLTSASATGTRTQTSTVTSLSGGAGMRFALRAVGTAPASAVYTDRTTQSFTAAGLTSSYHIYAAGINTALPVGMMFQFHGDGAYEYTNPTDPYSLGGPRGLIAECKRRNIILVPVRTPDTVGSITWWEAGSANADFVKALIDSLDATYSPTKLYLNGFSGGAQFITQFLLPKYPATFERGGNAVIFGGGDVPTITPGTFSATLKANFPMHWYTGEEDTAANDPDEGFDGLAAAQAGRTYYANLGFTTSLEAPLNEVHDMQYRFGPATAAYFRKSERGPTTWSLFQDFETDTGMSSGTWTRVNSSIPTTPPSGSYVLKSGTVASTVGATSNAVFPVPTGALAVRFKFYNRTVYDADFFQLLIGSDTVRVDSGIYTYGFKDSVEYDVMGQTSITFQYINAVGTGQASNPGVWVDDIEFEFAGGVIVMEPGRFLLAF